MAGGYMGKVLWVDLSANRLWEEKLDESMCRDFIGGYGIGARILYSRQKAGVDPLGPVGTCERGRESFSGWPAPGSDPIPANCDGFRDS